MGIPVPKTLLIWVSSVTLTLTQTPLRLYEKGMLISLGFWEWRSPKHGDVHITVTVPFTYVLSPQSVSLQQARKKVRGDSNGRKLMKINILLLSMVNSDRVFKKRYFYLRV